jgi:nitroreductase
VPREERDRLRQRPDIQSIGGAVQLLCTAAHALGYGSCWMTAPVLAAPAIEELLGVGPPTRLIAVVPIGRPASATRPTSRHPLEDVLEFR